MKSFILGVGAQKSGTTWLHHYLSTREDADFGFAKEYHIFDLTTLPQFAATRKRAEKRMKNLLERGYDAWYGMNVVKKIAFMSDPDFYFEYFRGLLNAPDMHITGDITPTYSALADETLQFIKDSFEKRYISTKPIFLMRDPVDRLQSMVRMNFRDVNIAPSYEQEVDKMRYIQASRLESIRGSYIGTVNSLRQVFGEDVFFEFFENLFSEETIVGLCNFLDVPYLPADLEHKVNVSKTENRLTDSDRQQFAAAYEKTYEFCRIQFGEEKVNRFWTPPV